MDIHIEDRGAGPPLLFIHAGVADSRMWTAQLGLPGHRTIAFDMRGYGQTPLGTETFSNTEDALWVLDAAGVDTAIVVGCSIGGGVALQVVEIAPERVAGLVLIGADAPGFDPDVEYEPPEWPEAVAAFGAGDLQRVAALEAEIWLAGIGRSVMEVEPAIVDLFIDMDLIALRNESERDELENASPLETIPDVDAPSLVIVGERDIPQFRMAAAHLARTLGTGPEITIRDSAHLPSLDRPAEVNRLLLEFTGSL